MSNQFHGERAILKRTITIESTPDAIFPLLCPVRESEWVDGWVGKPIFSKSGLAEENGVFASEHAGEKDTIWYVTRRDTRTHQIDFVFLVPDEQATRLYVRVDPAGANRSSLSVEYIRTGISEKGNEVVRNSQSHFDKMMTEWEASMNYFLKTGKLMKGSH